MGRGTVAYVAAAWYEYSPESVGKAERYLYELV